MIESFNNIESKINDNLFDTKELEKELEELEKELEVYLIHMIISKSDKVVFHKKGTQHSRSISELVFCATIEKE